MRHSVFPLKPYGWSLTKAQPPFWRLSRLKETLPPVPKVMLSSCVRGGRLAQAPTLVTRGGGGGDRLHFPEEVARWVLQPGSHQHLRRLCHGNGRGDPSDSPAWKAPERSIPQRGWSSVTGPGERTHRVRPCGFGEKPRTAPARARPGRLHASAAGKWSIRRS